MLIVSLCWITGVILAAHIGIPWSWWLLMFVPAVGLALALRHTTLPWRPLLFYLGMIAIAASWYLFRVMPPAPGTAAYLPVGGVRIIGHLLESPTQTGANWHAALRLSAVRTVAGDHAVTGTIYLFGTGGAPQPGRQYLILARVLPAHHADNPVGFSWQSSLQQHGYTYRVRAYQFIALPGVVAVPASFQIRERIRRGFHHAFAGAYRDLYACILEGIVLGTYGAPLPESIIDQFRQAGTIHVMVASGGQVALLGSFLLLPLGLVARRSARTAYPRLRRLLILLAGPLLAGYVWLADNGPSVDRAIIMTSVGLLAMLLACSPLARRYALQVDGITLLAASALVLLIANPAKLFHPGFQLSYLAVLGLMTVTPLCATLLHRWLGKWAIIPAATLGAQIMVAPILAWHFGLVPLLGPVTNLLVVPLVTLLLPLGLGMIVCMGILPAALPLLSSLAYPLITLLLTLNRVAATIPGAVWHGYVRDPCWDIAYYAAVAFALHLITRTMRVHDDWHIPPDREPRVW